jgi:hypothetical protein
MTVTAANAQHRDPRFDQRHRPHPQAEWRNDQWVIPALIFGGLFAYELNRQPVVIQQVPPQPIYVEPAKPVYREMDAYDPSCGCEKRVLIRVN